MSRVYFHSPSGTAELRGAERAHLDLLVSDTAMAVLAPNRYGARKRLEPLIDPGYRESLALSITESAWANALSASLRFSDGGVFRFGDHPIRELPLVLNTAFVIGNDQLRLAARIHGQCEMHGWVDGPNRSWLADIVQRGLDLGLYRKGFAYGDNQWQSMGWEDVVALLRERDDEPVVMSYSVCDGFPSPPGNWSLHLSSEESGDDYWDRWYNLSDEEKWRIGMAGLRTAEEHSMLELRPDNWDDYRFGHGLSMVDLASADCTERLQRAVDEGRLP